MIFNVHDFYQPNLRSFHYLLAKALNEKRDVDRAVDHCAKEANRSFSD